MPLHTDTTIRIEGNPRLAGTFTSLDIHESITGHHTFELALPGQAFGAGAGTGRWRGLVGKTITIEIAPLEQASEGPTQEPKRFSGLITNLSLGKSYGPNGSIVLTGGAPTLLLDDDPHTQAFAGQPLRRIADSQLSSYPKNLLKPQINPQTSEPLDYIVQYKENTWDFLRRLARTYGEWCYYNGENLVFGRRSPETISLTHDVHLDQFSLQMGLQPVNMALAGYDYHGDRVATSETQAPSGLNTHSQAMVDAGQSLFPRQGRHPANHFLNGAASRRIKAIANRRGDTSVAQMVQMSGVSHHPGLGVGDEITVEETLYGSETYGAFMLSEVHHRCSSDGEYSNHFSGIPADVATPPHRLEDHPTAGPQSAVVTDNNDPDDLGRVRVRMRWQDHGQTPWLRMVAPGGGKDKGVHMIPEKGEEVMVDFEGGHPERPYVLGTTRNSSSASGFGTPKNDVKAIKTRSGHTIELNDTKGGEFITIKDKNDNVIELDTAEGHIKISAPENIKISAKNIDINAQEKLSMGAEDISSSAGKQHMMMAKNMNIHADEEMLKTAKKMESTADAIKQNSTKDNLTLFSNKSVDLKSNEKVKLF